MKKIFFLILGAVMTLSGCNNTDDFDTTSLSEEQFTLTVAADDNAQTRANEISVLVDGSNYETRYILEIYHNEKNSTTKTLYQRLVQTTSDGGNQFNFRLVTNQEYTFLVWVDYTLEGTKDDVHYKTDNSGEGLQNITLMGTVINNDPSRDAFYGKETKTVTSTALNFSISCKRPFGQLNVTTTDWESVSGRTNLEPTQVKMEIAGAYRAFNVMDGDVTGTTTTVITSEKCNIIGSTSTTEKYLTCDYIFGKSGGYNVNAKIYFYNASGDDVTNTNEMLNTLPIKPNYQTNVTGNLLTRQGKVTVSVDAEWIGAFSVFELATALANEMNTVSDTQKEYVFQILGNTGKSGDFNVSIPRRLQHAEKITLVFAGGFGARPVIGFQGNTASPYIFTGELCILNTTKNALDYTSLVTYHEEHKLTLDGKWGTVTANAATINLLSNAVIGDLGVSTLDTDKTINIYGNLNRILPPAARTGHITINMKPGSGNNPTVRTQDADAVTIVNQR